MALDERDRVFLSKTMSFILRHGPVEFGLVLDPEGFVPLEELVEAVRSRRPDTTRAEVLEVVRQCEKGRFEVVEGDIRACYGHTVDGRIQFEEVYPPEVLYHGTGRRYVNMIMKGGLKPMGRQYVHLTVRRDFAEVVGRRRDRKPVILKVMAARAYEAYVPFYMANDDFYLADFVPPSFIIFGGVEPEGP